jgi:hypothetical protein
MRVKHLFMTAALIVGSTVIAVAQTGTTTTTRTGTTQAADSVGKPDARHSRPSRTAHAPPLSSNATDGCGTGCAG